MRMQFDGKTYGLTINQSTEKGEQVLRIDMESQMALDIQKVENEDGEETILEVKSKAAIDDLIDALIKFRQMNY